MTDLLAVHDLHVAVDGLELLRGVNLHIPGGEIHALLGPNGCGKTTLMMAIMGYRRYQVTGGAIYFDGIDITRWDITQRARLGLTMAHQRPPTLAGVTLHNLFSYILGENANGQAQGSTLAATYHVESLLDRSINAGLSGGEIKRSELVQMLAMHPRFALLDEPDSGIDLESLALIGQMVHAVVASGADRPCVRGALLVTHTGHILDSIAVDKAHIMLDGQLVCSGAPARLLDEIRRNGFLTCARVFGRAEEGHGSSGNGYMGAT